MENTTYRLPIQSEPVTKYYSGDQVNKNKIGVACSKYGGQEMWVQDFGGCT